VEQSQRAAEVKVEVGEQRELLLSAAVCCLRLLSFDPRFTSRVLSLACNRTPA
jgi:hypothetical protein